MLPLIAVPFETELRQSNSSLLDRDPALVILCAGSPATFSCSGFSFSHF